MTKPQDVPLEEEIALEGSFSFFLSDLLQINLIGSTGHRPGRPASLDLLKM